MQTMIHNLRYAWRQLRHSPGFTFLGVVTLALGIGANTAMFTVVESVLLRPLPYIDSNRLLHIGLAGTESSGFGSWLDYSDIKDRARTLYGVAAYSNDIAVVQSKDSSVSVVASEVTPNLFQILGVQPLRGRTFLKSEGQANGPQAVLLSEGLWREVFGADPSIVGRSVRVNGHELTVVGVMPRTFRFPESAGPDMEKGIWLPVLPTPEMLKERGYRFLSILAKPALGITAPQVQAELDVIAKRIRDTDSRATRTLTFRAQAYHEMITGPVRHVFLALVAALGLVLLIACANVANLLIARCLARQHEFAVRTALGSGLRRLICQVIVEAGLLSALGSALALLIAYWITAAIHMLPPGMIPQAEEIRVRWTVVLVLCGIATVTTAFSAVLPALFVARTDRQSILQATYRSLGTKSIKAKIGGWLVAGEVALSALLLVAAGLLFRTLWSLEHAVLGFETAGITSFIAVPADASGFGNMMPGAAGTEPASVATTVYVPLLEALRHTPGFRDAALITALPFSGFDVRTSFQVVGWPHDVEHGFQVKLTAVSGGYEKLMGTPVLRGRGIREQDGVNAPFVATINQAMARKYFAGKDPLGQRLDLGGKEIGMLKPYTIVGIIADQIDTGTSQPPQPLVMLPYQQIPTSSLFYPPLLNTVVHFVVKTRGNVNVAPSARATFHRIAPNLALDNFQTMQEAVDQSNFGARLGLYVIAAFAGLAVLMVIAGLYGVLSQIAGQRSREFGVRMALGATRQSILTTVLSRGLAIIAVGLAVGIVLASSMGHLIKAFLYGVKPLDTSTYVFVALVLLVVGTLGALVPAWRAASFEPVKTLREE
ncbi:MAG: ABC transporter permease [Acidobacteriaceae bacterium]|nr:ABC transporter permease [Acidobacteriaceae bacterium]MBV9295301.1 ABC transporter permease [Acidobacteriaceae bacterium]MBV9764888.1 ABC transporter permease [Acidobacteriaceae bacterium]